MLMDLLAIHSSGELKGPLPCYFECRIFDAAASGLGTFGRRTRWWIWTSGTRCWSLVILVLNNKKMFLFYRQAVAAAEVWPDEYIVFLIFGPLQQWIFGQQHKKFTIAGSQFCQILNKSSKNCQSGENPQNLVTLAAGAVRLKESRNYVVKGSDSTHMHYWTPIHKMNYVVKCLPDFCLQSFQWKACPFFRILRRRPRRCCDSRCRRWCPSRRRSSVD